MTELETEVAAFFGVAGALSAISPRYQPRPGQQMLAQEVARTLEQRDVLVAEAGTGVGKTYAYLVPAILSGRRTMISTATKALQDQLFGRDLPAVLAAANLPMRTALLKGRSSYLCQHRASVARQFIGPSQRHLLTWLARVEQWATQTASGDLAEVAGLDESSALVPLITSTRDNCLGSQCPQFRECHVNHARREALAADLVVVNHHLFFADIAVRESGVAELLPSVELLVFDEAHQLNEIGVQFLGSQLSGSQLLELARDALAYGLQAARGANDWHVLCGALERGVQDVRLLLGPGRAQSSRLKWMQSAPDSVEDSAWQSCLDQLELTLSSLQAALDAVAESAPDLARAAERAHELLLRLQRIRDPHDAGDAVRWVELGSQFRLVLTPLDVAPAFREKVLARARAAGASLVFASATLGTDDGLTWFTRPLGLDAPRTLRVPSPFDYTRQSAIHVPPDLPPPSDPGHSEAVAQRVWQWAGKLGGRTLVLTTTLRAVQRIADTLNRQAEAQGSSLEVLVQGQWSKRELLRQFQKAGEMGGAGAILVASASFWEGVDLPGSALQLVVIDKLPFPPPDDPLVEARSKRLETTGASPFSDYALPEATMALKQGAGRLIRSETDQGVLVVADIRLRRMGYGKRIMGALPPMRWLEQESELQDRLDHLIGHQSFHQGSS